MLSWFRGKTDKQENAEAKASVEAASAADKTDAPALLTEGMRRVEPATQPEIDLAGEFQEAVRTCRTKFAEPGFDLPTLPASAMKITTLLQESDVSARKVAETVSFDPVLTAKFLRIANSPLYGGNRKVDSIQVAVQRLGLAMVRSVVLAISLNSTIIREKRLGQRALELWDHSMSTALASQLLARRLNLDQPNAFTMGLMHDIGKLASWLLIMKLAVNRPEVRPNLMETLVEDAHAEVGEALVDVWGMPFEVRMVVGGHHAVSTLDEAMSFIKERKSDIEQPTCAALGSQMGCVILADRALAALGLAREPGDLNLGESSLAVNLGLPPKETLDFLVQLPGVLKENKEF